eukprot:Hpha_TRINITY_DN16691_c0_g1::TRINITY_DN16691_c0_g1_i2::g.179598::m.179598
MCVLTKGVTRQSGALTSTPDVTVVRRELRKKCRWRLLDCWGSDHFPQLLDVRLKRPLVCRTNLKKWRLKRADWAKFEKVATDELEAILASDIPKSATEMEKDLSNALTTAATAAIPRTRTSFRAKVWWSPAAEAAVQARRVARRLAARRPDDPE